MSNEHLRLPPTPLDGTSPPSPDNLTSENKEEEALILNEGYLEKVEEIKENEIEELNDKTVEPENKKEELIQIEHNGDTINSETSKEENNYRKSRQSSRRSEMPQDEDEIKTKKDEPIILDYIVHFNDQATNHPSGLKNFFFPKFTSNYIRTTKYTWWNFIPKNLFEQFSRISNFYFIMVMIFALLPGVSPIFPITSILPVIFILGTTLVKDGIEDFFRALSDRYVNRKKYTVVRNGIEKKIFSSDLKVGDVIKIHNEQEFPCDLMFLSSENHTGECFVSTVNLNGESNLKLHHSKEATKHLNTPELISGIKGRVYCEKPRFELEKFNGKLEIDNLEQELESVPNLSGNINIHDSDQLSSKNILLRGAILRNTKWIYGLALYAGKQTKLSLNVKKPKFKFSLLDKKLNAFMIFILALHLTIDLSFTFAFIIFQIFNNINSFYLEGLNEFPSFLFVLLQFFTVFILNNLLIPMSLFVSLEIIKVIQSKFMSWDLKMSQDGKHMNPITSNLNEDLSYIEYIFSDKTGTLTENIMNLNKFSIGNNILHDEVKDKGALKNQLLVLKDDENQKEKYSILRHFLFNLAICNTINPEISIDTNELFYDGSSIDEVALVEATRQNGVILKKRNQKSIEIEVFGKIETFEILNIIEFNSDRKKMTVIVKDENEKIICYTKGADNIMETIIKKDDLNVDKTLQHIDEFAHDGLRTLLIGYKEITKDDYEKWNKVYLEAQAAQKGKSKKIANAEKAIENDFICLGASAIEDCLQQEVPETIEFFRKAGVQVWVLTGDKRDTAVSIAKTSRLLLDTTNQQHIKGTDVIEVAGELQQCIEVCKNEKDVSIILDTSSFKVAHESLKELFLEAAKGCTSAICCRVTPIQKAQVVTLVQNKWHKIGLAIGDGANDVSMISEANVGVGIMGREGSQAARSADYAIPRFRHLKRLLAVHGRYSLVRNAYYIQYSFYKNMVLTFIQVYYNFFCAFTSDSILDSWYITFYNMIFTLLPPIYVGAYEKDYSEEAVENCPELYKKIKLGYKMTWFTFIGWFLDAVIHSAILYFFIVGIGSYGPIVENEIDDRWVYAQYLSMATTLVITYKAMIEMTEQTVMSLLCYASIFVTYFGWHLIYSLFPIFPLSSTNNYYWIFCK
eukprot:gene5715-9535_t